MCVDLLVFDRTEVTLCGRQNGKNPITNYLLSVHQNCVCKCMHLCGIYFLKETANHIELFKVCASSVSTLTTSTQFILAKFSLYYSTVFVLFLSAYLKYWFKLKKEMFLEYYLCLAT